MNFIVNEKMYVEKILESGEPSQRNTSRDLKLIAKYLLNNSIGQEEVINYIVQYMDNYNASGGRWKKTITGIVKDIVKQNNYYLRDIQEVRITQKEIEIIKNIHWEEDKRLNDRLRRYAFGLIVYAKILKTKKKDGWVRIDSTSVFCKDCGIKKSGSTKQKETPFHVLQDLGLLKIGRPTGSESIEVLFIDWEENNSDVVIPLKHIENFQMYYSYVITKEMFKCCQCNELFSIEGKRTPKYCKQCHMQREVERVTLHRKKNKKQT